MDAALRETLFIFAEVSVLFAGFGGLSVVIGSLENEIARARLRNVVLTALLILIMSLLPVVLLSMGLPEPWAWRISLVIFLAFFLVFYFVSGDLKLFMQLKPLERAMISGDWLFIALQVSALLGWFGLSVVSIYFATLFWHLLSACVMYLLVFAPVWSDGSGGER